MLTFSPCEAKTVRTLTSLSVICAALCSWSNSAGAQENCARFRGENGAGVSDQKGIPTSWSPGDYAWNIELPGVGHASPIVWKDKLFVTSAVDEGALRYLFCLNAASGEEIWSRQVGFSRSRKHEFNSWASSTPTTDGEFVYVGFADEEQYAFSAYSFDGDLVWRRCLGPYEKSHGLGASPILFEDLVIVPNLQSGPSSMLALDKRTGHTVWSSVHTFYRTSYATPIVVRSKGRQPQLICASGALGLASFNPRSGRLNWMTGEFPPPRRTVSSPVLADGLLVQTCGGGGKGNVLIAVDPTDAGEAGKGRVRYRRKKRLPYVPTPISHGGHLYLWGDNGVVNCVKTDSGETVWTLRIGGRYFGSPVCIDGKLYCMSEKGEMLVVPATPEKPSTADVQRTSLSDYSHSTPVVAGGRLFIRTFHRLAALEARQ